MKKYRIEDSHFLQYATRYEIVEGMESVIASNASSWIGIGDNKFKIQINEQKNYWFADYESFSRYVDILSQQGYTYVKAIHNAYTDGHGNVVIDDYPNKDILITPTRFYKGVGRNGLPILKKKFKKDKDTSTGSGKSKAWIITGILHYFDSKGTWTTEAFLSGTGRNGKFLDNNIWNASMTTEDTARQYIKNHLMNAEYANLKAISLIDYLALN